MGIRSALAGLDLTPPLSTAAPRASRASYVMASGSSIASLPTDVAAAFGINTTSERVTRGEAMSIPAMRRARSIIAGTIATLPLVTVRRAGDQVERGTRPLLDQPDLNTTRAWTVAWTVDSLLFDGIAWWQVDSRDAQGYPSGAHWVRNDRVMVDHAGGKVFVNGTEVDHADLIRFDGLDEGILCHARTLRTCLLLEDAVRRNSTGLPPQDFLKLAEGAAELSDEPASAGDGTDRSEIDALLDDWEDARQARSTAFMNRSIDHGIVGFDPRAGQLAEARLYQAAEVARLCNLDTEAVDAPGGGSATYANVESKRRERLDTTLSPFMDAIDQRLSMGDVTPRGTVVRFDPWRWLRGDTAGLIAAAKTAVDARILTVDEIRQDWFDRAPLGAADTTPPED